MGVEYPCLTIQATSGNKNMLGPTFIDCTLIKILEFGLGPNLGLQNRLIK